MSPDKRGEFALSFLSTYGVKPNGPPAAIEGGSRMRRRPSRTPWEECIMLKSKLSRRRLLATTAAAMVAMPYVRGAHAAGKLSVGFWDHWVPGANDTNTALVNEWAAKEKVEVSIDYIPSAGFKNLLTIAAEAQARSGHDIIAMPTWWPQDHAKSLE